MMPSKNRYYNYYIDKKNPLNVKNPILGYKNIYNKQVGNAKNIKNKKNDIIQPLNLEYIEEFNPPKKRTNIRRNSVGSKSENYINNISEILGKLKDNKIKTPNKIVKNKNNENNKKEAHKKETNKKETNKIEVFRLKTKIEEKKPEKINAEIKSEIKALIDTSEKNIMEKFSSEISGIKSEISEVKSELKNGFKFLGQIFGRDYEKFVLQKEKNIENTNKQKNNQENENNKAKNQINTIPSDIKKDNHFNTESLSKSSEPERKILK